MIEIEKLDLKSMDIVEEKREQLKALFPEVFTEGQKIDFERLKLTLGEMIDPGKERYGMNWPGKADCFKIIQQPSIATLTPAREESVDFDTTENLFIEGDNLEVLKLLQKSYFGKVKMIYIDPPYNTGNDFIYPDDYSESLDTYLRYTGQIDNEGRKYSTNTEADGRFHSKWMNMMYPRLFLARNLLQEDGVIFISIDDNEIDNLRKICMEVFGEEHFVADVSVVNNLKGRNDKKYIARANERLLMFVKSYEFGEQGLPLPEVRLAEFNEEDEDGKYRPLGLRKRGGADTRNLRPNMYFPIYVNKDDLSVSLEKNNTYNIEVLPKKSDGSDGCWRWGFNTVKDNIHCLIAKQVGSEGRYDVFEKDYLETDGVLRRIKPKSVMSGTDYSSDGATKAYRALMPDVDFTNPKPVPFMKDLITYSTSVNSADIILDFFSGSCTSAHATLDLNKEDGGNRKFIMVQLPEPTEENSEAHKAGYKTIADIGKERIRRVIKKIKDEHEEKKDLFSTDEPELDLGFKVFKLQPSNFKLWNGDVAKEKEAIEAQLEMFVDHINPKSSQEDILYELLLKSGFPLTTKIEKITLAEKTVFSIADGSMFICLEKELTPEVIKAMAEKKPVRVVCLDEGFKSNDQLKTNAVQIMKSQNITFRTV